MSKFVSPLQSSFIPGRGTHDNVIVIQEMLHSLRKSHSKVGGMIITLDLEKAYDKINWLFLEQTLEFFDFAPHIIRLIMFCVKSARPRVLWNGEPLQTFSPKCGLRQGDPLSPYLFVLCVERLVYLINEAVEDHSWIPLPSCRGGPKFSHLFFADDLMLMTKATSENAYTIGKILEVFYANSGLMFGCTTNLGKYLGVPLVHSRASVSLYRGLIDKVQSRLSLWKANMLNFAGSSTLINAVTTAMPSHVMQTTWLPTSVCDHLDKLNRAFLWATDGNQKKIHTVKWGKVTRDKSLGGLGIREARKINISFLAKIGWKLFRKNQCIWQDLLSKKEDAIHALQDCKVAYEVWEFILQPSLFREFMSTSGKEWIRQNVKRIITNTLFPDLPWFHVFIAVVWTLWGCRNRFVFKGEQVDLRTILFDIRRLARGINLTFPKVSECAATTWGILRDAYGAWVTRFSRKLGDYTINEAELLGLREGLQIAWNQRIERVIMEIDSEIVWNWVCKGDVEEHPLGNIISDCRIIMGSLGSGKLAPPFANMSTDDITGLFSANL
ncbi:hypothetical protein BUALT_Bualt18G0057700 [Buddleja alternifolia]|uniref:Reverse transcriptase domain-containing protein n=1 Tax=Buddleja alternifolia TaxID=168488 RepID=A0AAV6W965_9LAMI|nr:hypothetical protein BUALT_Bualt18G0057700 [Buddleja alternifolia]